MLSREQQQKERLIGLHKSWQVLLTVLLAGISVVYNQYKVPPAMDSLLAELSIDMVTGGWLMSIFAVAGVVLAFPAAGLFARLGPRQSGVLALGAAIAGSLLGTLANNPALLLLGRTIEGVSVGLIAVIAPAVIALWFEPVKRGLAMGFWSTWVPAGAFLALALGSMIISRLGWRSLWWSGTLFCAVALLVWILVVSVPPQEEDDARKETKSAVSWLGAIKLPGSWLLALCFFSYNFFAVSYGTWGPAYYQEALGLENSTASLYSSLFYLFSVPAALLSGRILSKTAKRERVLLVAIVLGSFVACWTFLLTSVQQVILFVIAFAVTTALFPPALFTLASETVPGPEYVGVSMGIVNMGSSLGTMLGPPMTGLVVETGGNWLVGTYPIVLAGLVAALAALVFCRLHAAKRS